jgi:hypothetical protein
MDNLNTEGSARVVSDCFFYEKTTTDEAASNVFIVCFFSASLLQKEKTTRAVPATLGKVKTKNKRWGF